MQDHILCFWDVVSDECWYWCTCWCWLNNFNLRVLPSAIHPNPMLCPLAPAFNRRKRGRDTRSDGDSNTYLGAGHWRPQNLLKKSLWEFPKTQWGIYLPDYTPFNSHHQVIWECVKVFNMSSCSCSSREHDLLLDIFEVLLCLQSVLCWQTLKGFYLGKPLSLQYMQVSQNVLMAEQVTAVWQRITCCQTAETLHDVIRMGSQLGCSHNVTMYQSKHSDEILPQIALHPSIY